MSDVYVQLARHLNRLPAGFPATASGVEIRILKRLFSEAISLRQKAEAERYVPPRNVYETYRNMACERDGHSG